MSVRETVLLVLDAADGRIGGRTAAQKLTYFGASAIGQDAGHRAHYYGPYSRAVEAALSNSAFADDVEEIASVGPYGRSYTYKLTDQGREVSSELRESHPNQAAVIDRTVGRLGELVPGYSQHPLSLAAKVDLIVREQGGTVEAGAIPGIAKQFGWDVSDEDVSRAVDILVGLDRVTTK